MTYPGDGNLAPSVKKLLRSGLTFPEELDRVAIAGPLGRHPGVVDDLRTWWREGWVDIHLADGEGHVPQPGLPYRLDGVARG